MSKVGIELHDLQIFRKEENVIPAIRFSDDMLSDCLNLCKVGRAAPMDQLGQTGASTGSH